MSAHIPLATYRLQFNRNFTFNDATKILDYLRELGITAIYASPILTSRRGSGHGYDVTNPNRLDPDLGTEKDFDVLLNELEKRGMGLLLDIVPNHMAASSENPWWMDVLENGPDSAFSSYFDIDWHPPPAIWTTRFFFRYWDGRLERRWTAAEFKLALTGRKIHH